MCGFKVQRLLNACADTLLLFMHTGGVNVKTFGTFCQRIDHRIIIQDLNHVLKSIVSVYLVQKSELRSTSAPQGDVISSELLCQDGGLSKYSIAIKRKLPCPR